MSDLPSLLGSSLSPAARKEAEQSLVDFSLEPSFLLHLLGLVLNASQNKGVRLAGSVFFKNVIKKRWSEDAEEAPISQDDKNTIRNQLVPAMIALSSPADKALRAQIAESVSVVAEHDFPQKWPELIDQLVASLSTNDYAVSLGVLETAHSIFNRWRSAIRTDELYTVINYVLGRFVDPFVAFFRQTAAILLSDPDSTNTIAIAQSQAVLMSIFYDLTCQDLPPTLEDNHVEFFGSSDGTAPGWFLRFLAWDPPALQGDPEDTTPSVPSQVKTVIMEIAELYTNRFPELFTTASSIGPFVQAVWALVGDGKRPAVADDTLVAQALRFLSTAIRSGLFRDLFGSPETIKTLVNGVVVPNVELRDHETEQFEDDPLEYIRVDLAIPSASTGGSSEGTTRRHAAADVLRALVGAGSEAEATESVSTWVSEDLQAFKADPSANWKRKDRAIYLLTAIAARGSTSHQGVTSTNALVKVVDWFAENVLGDLEAAPGSVHPILQVDAIRYLYTFRNQLTKDQLNQVIPLLVGHLRADNYVCYSYAAITIERILFIKQGSRMLFAQADIHDVAYDILTALFDKIESGPTPEKVSENDYLMKCAMRVIITARQSFTPMYQAVLARLVRILEVVSRNPSNPNFDQYLFEGISALIRWLRLLLYRVVARFVVAGNPETLPHFEGVLHGVCTVILQQDIEQFVPYTFQLLSQLLELHPPSTPGLVTATPLPAGYRALLPLLLTPAPWSQKGSIPGLVRFIRASLARDAAEIVTAGQIGAVLAVAQQRLIPSRINDGWGFELLEGVVQNIPYAQLSPYFPAVVMSLLTRLQANKTDKFANLFVCFLLYTLAIRVDGVTPDYVVGVVEAAQAGLWANLFGNILLPEVAKIRSKDRKMAVVGLTRLLTQSALMRQASNVQLWPTTFTALVKLFRDPQALRQSSSTETDTDAAFTAIDLEEQNAGYQAAYSRLAASEVASPDQDPVRDIADAQGYVGQELVRVAQEEGDRGAEGVKALIERCEGEVVGPFLRGLAEGGYML
ncbi:CAS/CSE protein [Gautieria morchelliformis]|nr:CAS/CSE protein [Gautieria morchelliformis]